MPSTPDSEQPWIPVINGPALRAARELWGTQRDLVAECARLGTKINAGNLHRAETGQRGAIGLDKILGVACALDIPVTDILTDYGRTLYAERYAEKAGRPA